jgi:hypothetical protein
MAIWGDFQAYSRGNRVKQEHFTTQKGSFGGYFVKNGCHKKSGDLQDNPCKTIRIGFRQVVWIGGESLWKLELSFPVFL